jgi:beta-galactosidase GanA
MRNTISSLVAALLMGLAAVPARAEDIPRLARQDGAHRLLVDGKPFLILGGELGNSSSSDLADLSGHWAVLKAANLNTVLAPVAWEQIEPVEGHFDFTVLDGMIDQARAHDMRLVLLWFGAWKNSMSTYTPAWVKRDTVRFPRARGSEGKALDILSPSYPATRDADAKAFAAMMAHLKAVDSDQNTDGRRTVLMIQVENEIGMIPQARDHAPAAEADFAKAVPAAALKALHATKTGTWEQVFGAAPATDELWQAWTFGRYVEAVTAAGKRAYPLPMYINAALNRPGVAPGGYPSAGPLPHLIDLWRAAAPSLDMLSPDIYFPDFTARAAPYDRPDQPLFLPEANQAGKPEAPANAFWAIGEHDAIGFSPFSIEHLPPEGVKDLGAAYALLAQLKPLIVSHDGGKTMHGFRAPVAFDGTVDLTPAKASFGAWDLTVTMVDPWTAKDKQDVASHGGLVIQTGPDEFLVAGRGITVTFATAGGSVGLESVREVSFRDGAWVDGRWLNGDQTHQGRHVRLPPEGFTVQRVKLYKFQ